MIIFGVVIYIAVITLIIGGLFAAAVLPVIQDEQSRKREYERQTH